METVKGKNLVCMLRLLKDQAEESAKRPAYLTDNSESLSVSDDTTITKDGAVTTVNAPETELEFTSLLPVGDSFIQKLKQAVKNTETIEAWMINLDEKGTGENSGKYASEYYRGFGTSFDTSAPAEGNVEISFGYKVNGVGQTGWATVPEDVLAEAMYEFTDTTKKTA